jgi:hypothetical protein
MLSNMEAKNQYPEITDTKADAKKENAFIESGTTEALDPEDEKRLIRKIDLQ